MKSPLATKFCLPKWLLYALLGFFIFSADVPSSPTQQKVPVRTEQCDVARLFKPHFSSAKFLQPVSEDHFASELEFLPSLLFYSRSIRIKIKNRTVQVLMFTPIGLSLIANFLPRSTEVSSFSNQG